MRIYHTRIWISLNDGERKDEKMGSRNDLINKQNEGAGIAGAGLGLAITLFGILAKKMMAEAKDTKQREMEQNQKEKQRENLEKENRDLSTQYGGWGSLVHNQRIKSNNAKIDNLR